MNARLLAIPATAVAVLAVALPAAADNTISVKDNVFGPKSTTVKKGTTVKFTWRGNAPHNVTVVKGPVKFRSATKSSGTYSKQMTRSGTYRITCTIHPGMDLLLRVT